MTTTYSFERIQEDDQSETHYATVENQMVRTKSHVVYFNEMAEFISKWWQPCIVGTECRYLYQEGLLPNGLLTETPLFERHPLELIKALREADLEEPEELDSLIRILDLQLKVSTLSNRKGMSIELIESSEAGIGLGTALVQRYQEESSYIVLYSTESSSSYWIKQGFQEFLDDFYIWSKEAEVLKAFGVE